jgi:hypothetical protein
VLQAEIPVRASTFIEELSGGLANRLCADIKFLPRADNSGSSMTGMKKAIYHKYSIS